MPVGANMYHRDGVTCASTYTFSDKRTLASVPLHFGRMVQALGATSNVMALLLVNMIGYAAGIQKTGRVADGIFIDREGIVAAGCGFAFVFSGVQASPVASCGCCFFHVMNYQKMLWQICCRSACASATVDAAALIRRAYSAYTTFGFL